MKKFSLSILFILLSTASVFSQTNQQKSVQTFVEQQDPFSKLELKLDRMSASTSQEDLSPVILGNATENSEEDDSEEKSTSRRKKLLLTLGGAAWIAAMLLIFQGTGGGSSAY